MEVAQKEGKEGHNPPLQGEGQQRVLITKIFWEMVRSPAYEALLQDEPYLHRRKIIRYTLPGERNCTGGHYDLIYLRAGTDRLYSSWIPIGDIPVEMGGLLYLEGSDALGREMEAQFGYVRTENVRGEKVVFDTAIPHLLCV